MRDRGRPRQAEFAPIDLGHFANQSITDTGRRAGWLSLGPEHDLGSLPRGLQWWGGVPYRIADKAPEAILLAAQGGGQDGPGAVRGILAGTSP